MNTIPQSLIDVFSVGVDAVCFDVDSTLCTTEGIDEFATFLGVGDEVASLTKQAMDGGMSFREALSSRLSVMKITQDKLAQFVECHPPTLCSGVADLIALLDKQGVKVFLVSGGFTDLIYPVLPSLNGIVPESHVFANKFTFDSDSTIASFDPNQPTSASGGKAVAVQIIMNQFKVSNIIAIGDGATDLEAKPNAKAVIGYGGIAAREKVITEADWFVYDFNEVREAFISYNRY